MASVEQKVERLQKFYEKVKKMRFNQEKHFQTAKGSPMKKSYFDAAREQEKDVDGFIKIMEYEGSVDKK